MHHLRQSLLQLMGIGLAFCFCGLATACLPASVRGQASSTDQAQQPSHRKGPAALKAQPKIHPDVYRRLEKSRDGRVYVMVTLKPLPKEAVSDEQRTAAAKKSQDELIAEMPPDIFEVGYRFERDPIVFGYAKTPGLEKLARNTNVQTVQYKVEPEVHRRLKLSSDGFVFVLVVVNSQECDRLWEAIPETQDARPLLEQLERLAKRIQGEVLVDMSPREFRVFSKDTYEPDFWGWVSKDGLEKLAKHPKVGVGATPEEPPRD